MVHCSCPLAANLLITLKPHKEVIIMTQIIPRSFEDKLVETHPVKDIRALKKRRYFLPLLFILLLLSCLGTTRIYAQASLLTEDIIDDIKVKPGGDEKKAYTVTVVRDAFQREQWYYVPNAPRLVERIINGKRYPEFALVKYQYD